MKQIKPELLAPAGNLKKLRYAFEYGADAVYCGLPNFSLRAKTGFDNKSLKAGISYARKIGKKIYVTINIFSHNKQIDQLSKHLEQLKNNPPDAIILSDPGILNVVKKKLPKVPIHLSTQANTLNYEAVKFWSDQGVKRIVLGREVSLIDIKKIHKMAPQMELEVFVHGAMCLSYSGRCYLSAWINDRSANEGLCTQVCRWDFNVYLEDKTRLGKHFPVQSDEKGTYILNSKDLRLIDHLKELADAGVCSFKLEGRTKSIYYLAVVVKAYRQAIDLFLSRQSKPAVKEELSKLKQDLDKIDNRGYHTGFLFGNQPGKLQNFKDSQAKSNWEFSGEIVKITAERIFVRVNNLLKNNSLVECISPTEVLKIKIINLEDKSGKLIDEARGGNEKIFSFENPKSIILKKMMLLRTKK